MSGSSEIDNESINDRLLLYALHFIEKRAKNIPSEWRDSVVLVYTNIFLFMCYYVPPMYIIFKYISNENDDFYEFFQEDNCLIAYQMLISFIQNIVYNVSIIFDIPNIIIGFISIYVFESNALQIIIVFILQKLQQSYDTNITSVQNKDDMYEVGDNINTLKDAIENMIEYNIELEEKIYLLEEKMNLLEEKLKK